MRICSPCAQQSATARRRKEGFLPVLYINQVALASPAAGKCNKAKWQGVFGVTCYLSGRKKAKKWSGWGDSNPRLSAPKADALTRLRYIPKHRFNKITPKDEFFNRKKQLFVILCDTFSHPDSITAVRQNGDVFFCGSDIGHPAVAHKDMS